ncbi:MAG: beta-lactamase family protein [Xanthomonadales bacterium]|nr:beta-lactamase family protein [Xanthomonadales bacterium]
MKCLLHLLLLSALLLPVSLFAGNEYYPPRGQWQHASADAVGMDAAKLAEAVVLAREKAVVEPGSLVQAITDAFAPREPDFRILGPTRPRQGSAGLIIRKGYIVAEWGDLERVDMTFSAVKSYLSTIMALALRDGLVDDIHAPVSRWVRDGKFASEHNSGITWHHLMNQTSDWQGTLWGVPDWADRPEGEDRSLWSNRELHEPGSYFKYNDVRINLAAYSLLQVWREPLPVVLKREVMDPIGASTTWRWYGYENSWVTLDGQKMQSVSGGGHFGGGLFISTLDHARMGLLFLRNGTWQGRQIIPADWIEAMRKPTPARPDYGYMWWLNTNQERIPEAPASAFWAAGFGGNFIYIDQLNDLLIVLRWVPALEEVVPAVMAAIISGNER